ncbi:MAG: hypothetical protein R2911_11605 [Caldilineaceae bacterium]
MTIGRSGATEQNYLNQVTVEHLLYGVLLLGAGALRFFALGGQPLTSAEALNSWLAWLAGQGLMAPTGPAAMLADMRAPSSPLLFALHSLLFWIGADTDAAARLIPALFGTALVLLPWFLRPYLGRTGALLAALLLAVDPWLAAYSRLADGLILSIFCGVLTLIGILHLALPTQEPNADVSLQRRWLYVTAVSAGLLFVSGVGAWNFAPVLLLAWVLFGRPGLPVEKRVAADDGVWVAEDTVAEAADDVSAGTEAAAAASGEVEASPPLPSKASSMQPPAIALILFAAAVVLGATAWFSQPAGFGYISTSLSDWIGQLLNSGDVVYPLSWLWLRLLVDQPLLMLFGPIGLLLPWLGVIRAPNMPPRWPLFLTAWLAWGLLWGVSAGRGPLMLPMLGLPLLAATAHLGEWLLHQYADSRRAVRNSAGLWAVEATGRETALLVTALAILTVTGLFWLLSFVNNQQLDTGIVWISILILGLAGVLLVGFAFWTNQGQSMAVLGLYVGALLLAATLSSSWQLNQTDAPRQPEGFFAETSADDVRNLADDIGMIGSQRAGDPHEMPLIVQMRAAPDPVLAWYLRDMRKLTWALAPAAAADSAQMPLLVTFAEDAPTVLPGENYSGSHYQLRADWLPSALLDKNVERIEGQAWSERLAQSWSTKYRPLLRWLLFRKIDQDPPVQQVVLWAGY